MQVKKLHFDDNDPSFCESTLIIEDDEDIRESFKFALEFEGYRVFTACNGKDAISVLSKIPKPCLIFLDLMMPVMNGVEFLKAIENEKAYSSIPVVVVSAFTDRAKNIKVNQIVSKPIDLAKVLDIAKEYCAH